MRTALARAAAVAALALFAGACDGDSTGIDPDEIPFFLDCDRLNRISTGQTVSGTLGSGDCTLSNDDSYIDFYRLQLSSPRTVTITMESDDVDSFLFLIDDDGFEVDQDDDSGGGFDAEIFGVPLPAGTYYIGANTFPGERGQYRLSVR